MSWEIKNFLEIKNGIFHIDGVSSVDLAREFGTPLFVFSRNRIYQNLKNFKRTENLIPLPLKICYAAKANSNMAVLREIKNFGADLEVNSGGELFKALKIGFRPEQIIFNGTSKTEKEIEDAINFGIYAIQTDSLFELEMTEKIARKLNKRANVSLRLVPEIESGTKRGLQTALLTSKFGMMPLEALKAFSIYEPDNKFLKLCGIHLHIGSQNPDPESYSKAFLSLFNNLFEIFEKTGHKLEHLNLGGGFPVNYLRDKNQIDEFPNSQKEFFSLELDPASILENAWKKVLSLAKEKNALDFLKGLELLVEPGRSIIADAGLCLTTVRNKKKRPIPLLQKSQKQSPESPNDTWLLTDAGFNILLSMETYKWYYHLISANRTGEKHDSLYKVAGPLCDGGDVYFDIESEGRLPDYRKLPKNIEVGEILALLNCGAYSIAQMFQYNGRELPAIVLVKENGRVEQIRKRDSYEDLLINDLF